MFNQNKMIIIDTPPGAGPITRYRFWNEKFKVRRPLKAMPDILQPGEELYMVVGGNIDRGSLQTAMQALGMTTGGSASGFMNALPGLLFALIGLSILSAGFMLSMAAAGAVAQVPLIGAPLAPVVSLVILRWNHCVVGRRRNSYRSLIWLGDSGNGQEGDVCEKALDRAGGKRLHLFADILDFPGYGPYERDNHDPVGGKRNTVHADTEGKVRAVDECRSRQHRQTTIRVPGPYLDTGADRRHERSKYAGFAS